MHAIERRDTRGGPRASATVSLARSMNSSIIRCAMLRSAGMIASTRPSASSTISGCGRSKSIAPRRRRRACRRSKTSRITSTSGSRRSYFARTAGSRSVRIALTSRVGHPRRAADHTVVEFVAHDGAFIVDLHQARLHEAIDAGLQAAEIRRQIGRQHVDRAFGEVHRRAPVERLVVEGAALGHVVRDVRDVHAEPAAGRSAAAPARWHRRSRARRRRRS